MDTMKKPKSTKIKRSFTIEPDLFRQFKSQTAKLGIRYSIVLESLISEYLKNKTK